MTQIEAAKNKIITPQMREIARDEGVDAHILCKEIAEGRAVILRNKKRRFTALADFQARKAREVLAQEAELVAKHGEQPWENVWYKFVRYVSSGEL